MTITVGISRTYSYKNVQGKVRTNTNTGITYGKLTTYKGSNIPNSYHFKVSSIEEEEGVFQEIVNKYLKDMQRKSVAHTDAGYTLNYSIIGLPYTIKGSISLPTAKDVVILYIINNNDLHDLKETIDVCEGLLIKYDKAALWKTLPQWLKATITTINTMIDARYDSGMDNSDCYEVTKFIDTLTLEPPTDNLY